MSTLQHTYFDIHISGFPLQMSTLEKALLELQQDNEYNLHIKDNEWAEALRLQKDEFKASLMAERDRYAVTPSSPLPCNCHCPAPSYAATQGFYVVACQV